MVANWERGTDEGSYVVPGRGARRRPPEGPVSPAEYVARNIARREIQRGMKLTALAGNLLCDFVLSRLQDSEGLGSCAKALMALEERGKWDNDRVATVMNAFVILKPRPGPVSLIRIQVPYPYPSPSPV
jgi:hypothetical protein